LFAFVFFLWVVSICVLICLVLLMDGFPSLIFTYKVILFFLVDRPKLDPITFSRFLVELDSIGIHLTLVLKKANLVQLKVRGLGHHHLCHGNSRHAHMKAYAFVFTKTHGTNHWCKPSPLVNHDNKNFYFAFVNGTRPPHLLQFLRPTWNPPLHPSNLSLPFCPFFPFFFFFFLFYFTY
jgi:hypothetical protein